MFSRVGFVFCGGFFKSQSVSIVSNPSPAQLSDRAGIQCPTVTSPADCIFMQPLVFPLVTSKFTEYLVPPVC